MNPDIIDLREQLAEIRDRYPEYGNHPQSSIDAAVLWGNPPHNECGVLESSEVIPIELDGQKRWKADIRLAQTPNGRYAMSTSLDYPSGSRSSAPSVWNGTAYLTREAAVSAGFDDLIRGFEGVRDWTGSRSHTEPILAQRMVELLQAMNGGARQLSLF